MEVGDVRKLTLRVRILNFDPNNSIEVEILPEGKLPRRQMTKLWILPKDYTEWGEKEHYVAQGFL